MTTQSPWLPPATIPHHHSEPCDCEPTIAYVRVSKVGERDPDSLKSPDIQLDAIAQHCERYGKRIVRIISDMNRTGRTFRKRSVDQCIELIKAGEAKGVALWKWSRWGRNVEYSKAYLGKVKAAGGRVDSATEDFDQNTAVGRLSQGMVMQFDEFQSDLISEGWKAVHARRRTAALPHSGRKRFGYEHASVKAAKAGNAHGGSDTCADCAAGREHFAVHAVEGPALVRLYERYVAGVGFEALAERLNGDGLRTPFGDLWTKQAVGQMMDTGFAAGWIRERSEELKERQKLAGKAVRNSLSNFDVWRRGAHPAIISEDLWRKYLDRREAMAGRPPRARTPVHALSSLLFCELCARRLQAKYTGAKRQHSWVCPWRKPHHPETAVSVSNSAALRIIRQWVDERSRPLAAGQSIDDIARREMAGSPGSPARTLEKVRAEIAAERRAQDKLALQHARDLISDETLVSGMRVLDESLARLRDEERGYATTATSRSARPSYEAFGKLGDVWDEALAGDPSSLNEPLRRVLGFVIVSPASGRGRWHDAAERVEVIGRWAAPSMEAWFEARRRRFPA